MAPKEKQFYRKRSDVIGLDESGQVFKNYNIWTDVCPSVKEDKTTLFGKCLILPGSTAEVFKCKQVEPVDQSGSEFDVKQANAFNCNAVMDPMAFNDIGLIPYTNVPCALDYLKGRFMQNQIYSTADPLLVAINPFKNIGNATEEYIKKYRDISDVGALPPHVFSLARVALENMHMVKKAQTIIVSGESGAGKTEATKQVMRYFAAAKSGTLNSRIQDAVMAANPVLEAFGNAKTIRNNNSSRFGRYMQLQVGSGGGIEYGSVKNFLLEKSRILMQTELERNYHIFYQLIKGTTPEQKKKYHIRNVTEYKFINPKMTDAPGIDDLEEWDLVTKAFDSMGMTDAQKNSIYSVVSGVLILGDVKVISVEKPGVPDAAAVHPDDKGHFEKACDLLMLDAKMCEEGITIKISVAGGQEVRGHYKQADGEMLKDSLSKAMFDKLFDWIIVKLNGNIQPPDGFKEYMGMLDIFGFEVFANNSLEQLFINITNEMLQKNFIDVVFDKESKLYRDEGISTTDLVWTSNGEVITMLTAPKGSLMSVLEDQCLAPGGNDEKFLSAAYKDLAASTKLVKPKISPDVNFLVDHTIGEIQYNCHGFLFKNKDVLKGELVEVVQASPDETVRDLFANVVVEKGKMPKGQFIGTQFLTQLTNLMALINSTEPHFIRCVKPNEEKKALLFTADKTLVQLHALSILEAIQLRNLGYSYRRPFKEFLFQYRFVDLAIAENPSLEPKEASKKIFERASVKEGWQIGKTMVFMKAPVAKEMVIKQRQALAAWAPIVGVLESWWSKKGYKKEYYENLHKKSGRISALARKKLAGKVEAPPPEQKVAGWV